MSVIDLPYFLHRSESHRHPVITKTSANREELHAQHETILGKLDFSKISFPHSCRTARLVLYSLATMQTSVYLGFPQAFKNFTIKLSLTFLFSFSYACTALLEAVCICSSPCSWAGTQLKMKPVPSTTGLQAAEKSMQHMWCLTKVDS